jgi:hypothetical protein
MTTFGAVPRAWFSGALLGSDGVEHGPTLFYVIAAAEWADDATLFVLVETQLFCERLPTITAVEKVRGHSPPPKA